MRISYWSSDVCSSDLGAQQFGWPEGLQRGITLALVLGFFVTLVLAWYHGERGEQRVSGAELLVLALLLAVGGGVLWRFNDVFPVPVPVPVPDRKSTRLNSRQSCEHRMPSSACNKKSIIT